MIPPALRHPSVIVTALACIAATAVLTGAALRHARMTPSEQWETTPRPLPAIDLLQTDGRPFTNQDMAGQIWVCDFFLTHCLGMCPRLAYAFDELGKQLDADPKAKQVRLLSISVDPTVDTPEVLRDYRTKRGLAPHSGRWLHVTSATRDATWTLCKQLYFHVAENPGNDYEPIIHTDRILLIDGQGRIRGSYKGLADIQNGVPDDLAALKNDLSILISESTP